MPERPFVERSVEVIGDRGAWARHPAVLWPALADPALRTTLPVPHDDEALEQHVEHWAPLLALTYGALGWARPDLGVARWLADGMPHDDGALDLVARWYGERAAGLVAWSRASTALTDLSLRVSHEVGLPLADSGIPLASGTLTFPALTRGGPDPLQLHRVVEQLVGSGGGVRDEGHLMLAASGEPSAVLVLDRYVGWYRVLHDRTAALPALRDGRTWTVDVVVRSIGSLGVYRRSSLTRRWFTGSEAVHVLGWPPRQWSTTAGSAPRGAWVT